MNERPDQEHEEGVLEIEIPQSTPMTDREVYTTGKADVGFKVVNPALARSFERKLSFANMQLQYLTENMKVASEALSKGIAIFTALQIALEQMEKQPEDPSEEKQPEALH